MFNCTLAIQNYFVIVHILYIIYKEVFYDNKLNNLSKYIFIKDYMIFSYMIDGNHTYPKIPEIFENPLKLKSRL